MIRFTGGELLLLICRMDARTLTAIFNSPGKRPTAIIMDPVLTIVACIYNVERYLDQFFLSLIKQSLDFQRNIQLILIGDGCSDKSLPLCEEFQRKHPDNTLLISQQNMGLQRSRNRGLEYAKGKWIAFIDPDDVLSPSYFDEAIRVGSSSESTSMIVCRLIRFWDETPARYGSDHLDYKFSQGPRLIDITLEDQRLTQSSGASAIFKLDEINRLKLRFNPNLKRFDDGEFICRYILDVPHPTIAISPESIYFYRQRSESESTSRGVSFDACALLDVIQHGFIPLIRDFKSYDTARRLFLEKTILIELSWTLRRLISTSRRFDVDPSLLDKLWFALTSLFKNFQLEGLLQDIGSGFSSVERFGIIMNFFPDGARMKFKESAVAPPNNPATIYYFFDFQFAQLNQRLGINDETHPSALFFADRYFLSRSVVIGPNSKAA